MGFIFSFHKMCTKMWKSLPQELILERNLVRVGKVAEVLINFKMCI